LGESAKISIDHTQSTTVTFDQLESHKIKGVRQTGNADGTWARTLKQDAESVMVNPQAGFCLLQGFTFFG